jgi:hypothetical protein
MCLISSCPKTSSLPANRHLPAPDHRAVQLVRVVGHFNCQGFLFAVKLEVFRYAPRVPAGAVSAKRHHALGDDLAVGATDDHLRVERHVHIGSRQLSVGCRFTAFLRGVLEAANHDIENRVC